jgi:ferredoxin-NADP reductase/predicted pyridoxine 5'-phosphate oxidase superfamily flavin-nucleotide-binding protein
LNQALTASVGGSTMAHKYAQIAFTDTVRTIQTQHNSRSGYASMDEGDDQNYLLSDYEAEFLAQRDSFYMASVNENNWPYLQHRGGPKGFMKVINASTIGFADFSGNRQYVSTGNFKTNDRVALFFMDYPNRRRLKMFGRVTQVHDQDWDMLAKLEIDGYRATVERGFLITIEGFDWNCPQHITPRFTEEDVEKVIAPILKENETLKTNTIQSKMPELGTGSLRLVVTGIRQLTPNVRAYELRNESGLSLPSFQAGAHLKIPVQLSSGNTIHRHYSICSNPKRTDIYEIAVQKEANGQGGSNAIHANIQLGQVLLCDEPTNYFKLHNDDRPAILIAGGIGITPIKAMAQALQCRQVSFHLHYAGRSLADMPFQDRLKRALSGQISFYSQETNARMDIANILKQAPEDAWIYVCGPNRLLEDVIQQANIFGLDADRIVYERFSQQSSVLVKPISVTFAKSNKTVIVSEHQSILDAAIDAGIDALHSCKTGQCKTCAVTVLNGKAKHHDNCLTDQDRNTQNLMCPCVSRSTTDAITLDL